MVGFDEEGLAAFERFTAEMDAAEEASGESPLTRVREHAIKLALTVAVGVNPAAPVITAAIFDSAIKAACSPAPVVAHARGADRIADNEREAACKEKILGIIRRAGKTASVRVTSGIVAAASTSGCTIKSSLTSN